MKLFSANSYQLDDDKKWVPAGSIITVAGDTESIQSVEFPPPHRFDTKERADQYFSNYYRNKGLVDKNEVNK